MTNPNGISLITDEYLISTEDHEKMIQTLRDLGYSTEGCHCDTHAKGGPGWFPTDFILFVGSHIFDAVLAVLFSKGFDWLMAIFRKTKEVSVKGNFSISTNFIGNTEIYFELDTLNYKNGTIVTDEGEIAIALKKIPETLTEIRKSITAATLKLLGSPNAIIIRYDFPKKEWLLFDHDSDASIYYAGTPFATEFEEGKSSFLTSK